MVGVVMFLAALVPYGLVQITAASPDAEVAAATAAIDPVVSPSVGVTAAASPVVFPTATVEVAKMLASVPATTMLFATGVTLLGLAAAVRRHHC